MIMYRHRIALLFDSCHSGSWLIRESNQGETMKNILAATLLSLLASLPGTSAFATDCTAQIPAMPISYDDISKAIVCHNVVDTSKIKTIDCFSSYLSDLEKLSCVSVINPKTSKRINCQEWPLHPLDFEFCTRINVNEQLYFLKFIN